MTSPEQPNIIRTSYLPALSNWDELTAMLPDAELSIDPSHQTGLSQGRQSEVYIITNHEGDPTAWAELGTNWVLVWKRMAVHKQLSHDEALRLQSSLRDYQNNLYQAGWRLPALFASEVINGDDGGFGIACAEQFIPGGDGEILLKDPSAPEHRKQALVEEVIMTLYAPHTHGDLPRRVLAGKEVSALPYGLDLKPANIVLIEPEDLLFVIDVFGPKQIGDDGQWLTYFSKIDSLPAQSLQAVTASREGAILRFWRLSEQFWAGDSMNLKERRAWMFDLLLAAGAPRQEVAFIADEISHGYPWLDEIYRESAV